MSAIPYTDRDLLRLIAENNFEAFDLLYKRYWAEMFKSAFVILKDSDACKDIVQDIFVWIWEHRNNLEINNPKSYLKVAVKFKVANYIRSNNIRESFFKEATTKTDAILFKNPECNVELKELNGIIQRAIISLPKNCKEIYQESREQYLSNREIAEKLGISIKTVENQMTIALSRIKSALETYIVLLLFPLIVAL